MKRRLDLALALVHRPRILFLDEPTTGLDPQSRTRALGGGRSGSPRDDGVTVFLTTQYLEEADVLADRVGIIDHGRIVAEGTPAALKAEIGRPSVEVDARRPGELDRDSQTCWSASASGGRARPRARRRAAAGGDAQLADVVRALDAEDIAVAAPAAARADARRRLPRQDRPHARGRGRRGASEDGGRPSEAVAA